MFMTRDSFGLGCLATSKPKRVPAYFHRTLWLIENHAR
jgi:hypothetical protein